MKSLEEIYKPGFFSKRYKLKWRTPIICDRLQVFLGVKLSDIIIDLGCGTGDIIQQLELRGFDAKGIEGSLNAEKYFETNNIIQHDLRKLITDFNLYKAFDLVMSIEVAEHLEPEYAEKFVANIAFLARDKVLITAAPEDSKGHYHVNCQPSEYWIRLFQRYDLEYQEGLTNKFRGSFAAYRRKKGINTFYHNSLVFRNKI